MTDHSEQHQAVHYGLQALEPRDTENNKERTGKRAECLTDCPEEWRQSVSRGE